MPRRGGRGSAHIQNASVRAWVSPLARTARSGASQCPGVKSSLTMRFTLTPKSRPGSVAPAAEPPPQRASASNAASTDIRVIVRETLVTRALQRVALAAVAAAVAIAVLAAVGETVAVGVCSHGARAGPGVQVGAEAARVAAPRGAGRVGHRRHDAALHAIRNAV